MWIPGRAANESKALGANTIVMLILQKWSPKITTTTKKQGLFYKYQIQQQNIYQIPNILDNKETNTVVTYVL